MTTVKEHGPHRCDLGASQVGIGERGAAHAGRCVVTRPADRPIASAVAAAGVV